MLLALSQRQACRRVGLFWFLVIIMIGDDNEVANRKKITKKESN